MSILLTGIKEIRTETSAEELRWEIAERAQRAYERSLRLRRIIVLASLVFSLSQSAYTAAVPEAIGLPLSEAVMWGVPLFASFFALSLEWSCRLHRDQSRQQYADYLYYTSRRAATSANRLARAA